MRKQLRSWFKPVLRSLVAIVLMLALALGHTDSALAAGRGGGRIGGGSFRAPAPSRTYSAPRSYAPYPGGYYPGGGIGFPLIWSPFVFGGGGLFSILILIFVANLLMQAFRGFRQDGELESGGDRTTISVARVQVGLLAEARELQADLDRIARKADTGSSAGLAQVLQETSLALLRHPEYWAYAASTEQKVRLATAETEFNRMLLSERSKFSQETLVNVNNQIKQVSAAGSLAVAEKAGDLANLSEAPGEYIVVTLLVGVQGDLNLPKINNTEDLRQALQRLGGVASDRLLALEVLWTPQAEGEVLTSDDLLVEYPNLKLI